VPTGEVTHWTTPPFQPDIRHGYLYGRGAADMKAAIAAMMIAVKNFLQNDKKFRGSIAFLLTSDEEGAAVNGTAKVIEVLQRRQEKIDYCIVGEPSSNQQIADEIRVGRRGSLQCHLMIHGKQGHIAYPHLAENPVHAALLALHELTETKWDEGNEFYPPTTFQISNIHAGTGATNVIPGQMEIFCNFRFGTAVTASQLQQRTESILNKHGIKFLATWHESAQSFLSRKGKLITATEEAIKQITGKSPLLSTAGGTSDGRFIAPTGAEVVEIGVANATAHHVDECVKIDDLQMLVKIYQMILMKVFV